MAMQMIRCIGGIQVREITLVSLGCWKCVSNGGDEGERGVYWVDGGGLRQKEGGGASGTVRTQAEPGNEGNQKLEYIQVHSARPSKTQGRATPAIQSRHPVQHSSWACQLDPL